MSSAIATLRAILGLDAGPFRREIDGAHRKTQGFERGFARTAGNLRGALGRVAAGLGIGLGLQQIAAVVKGLADLKDAAARADVSTDVFQALSVAADHSGNSIEQVSQLLDKVRGRLAAINGGESGADKLAEQFARLGISVGDIATMRPEDALAKMGAALRDGGASAEEFNAINEVFGERIGPKMVEMLKEIAGSDGIGAYTDAMKKAGQITKQTAIEMADVWDDAVKDSKRAWRSLLSSLATGFRKDPLGLERIQEQVEVLRKDMEMGALTAAQYNDLVSKLGRDDARVADPAVAAAALRTRVEKERTERTAKFGTPEQKAAQFEEAITAAKKRQAEARAKIAVAGRDELATAEAQLALERALTSEAEARADIDKLAPKDKVRALNVRDTGLSAIGGFLGGERAAQLRGIERSDGTAHGLRKVESQLKSMHREQAALLKDISITLDKIEGGD